MLLFLETSIVIVVAALLVLDKDSFPVSTGREETRQEAQSANQEVETKRKKKKKKRRKKT